MQVRRRRDWVDFTTISIPETKFTSGLFSGMKVIYTWNIPQKYVAEKFTYDMIIEVDGSKYRVLNVGSKEYIRTNFRGGAYGSLKGKTVYELEVHHCPANSINGLNKDDGPSIQMLYEDHRATKSCGSSEDAKAYRAKQIELIRQWKFREAMQMDIYDIRSKFGSKYDTAI